MPVYIYKVRDRAGKVLEGQMEASDGKILRVRLAEKGYFIIEYFEKKPKEAYFSLKTLFGLGRIKLADISIFSWQLYTMVDAGLPLINSLRIIVSQTKSEKLKSVIDEICHRLEEGMPFSDALKEHPDVFSPLYIHMINAGEVGGVLDEMLRRLAVFYEGQAEVRARVKSALTYPALLLFVSLGVAIFLVSYILPKFVIIFEDIGASIPLPTQILLHISRFIKYYWYAILGLILGALIVFKVYLRTEAGSSNFDKIKLRLPIVGDLITKATVSRFAQTLSILVGGGISILTSLDVVTQTIGNKLIARVLKDVSTSVSEGKSVAQPLQESKVFPPTVVNMIRVGEETGALDKMLAKIADFYDREVDNAIETFTKLIEPVLIVLMTVLIGLIAMSVFLPMTDIMQQLHR